MVFKSLTHTRVMRLLNGKLLREVADNGDKFKDVARKEINRRERRREKKGARGSKQ